MHNTYIYYLETAKHSRGGIQSSHESSQSSHGSSQSSVNPVVLAKFGNIMSLIKFNHFSVKNDAELYKQLILLSIEEKEWVFFCEPPTDGKFLSHSLIIAYFS